MNLFERSRLNSSYDIDTSKSLPVQDGIRREETQADPLSISSFAHAYSTIEAVRRGVDLVVDLGSEVNFDVKEKISTVGTHTAGGREQIRNTRLHKILNIQPNSGEDKSVFRRKILMDLILAGNAFMYFDGAELFRIPADRMSVHAGKRTKVSHYEYRPDGTKFKPHEIIHIADNAASSNLVGSSRLLSARNSITTMYEMLGFQQNFFKNGAVPGLVLTTPNILGKKIKERLIDYWIKTYNPKVGGRRPLILDGDFKVQTIASTSFKELDFEPSVEKHEDKILTSIGVPPILLKGGNNANIKPNMQLLYFTTVLPAVDKVMSGLESFFGYDLAKDVSKIASLQPELQDQSSYQTSLVNAGIITVNEARSALRFEKSDDPEADKLVKPANIAGSAANPSEGGRPPKEDKE